MYIMSNLFHELVTEIINFTYMYSNSEKNM